MPGTKKDQTPTATTLALHNWWRRQHRWRTKADAARDLGMPYSTFNAYFYGSEPRGRNREVLYQVSGLEEFETPTSDTPQQRIHRRAAPDGSTVDQLEGRLSEVADTARDLAEQFGDLRELLERMKTEEKPAPVVRLPRTESAERRADAAVTTLYQLIAILDTFRASEHDRAVLRQRIHGPDVGYLVSLVTALLDEGKFESWSAVSSYRPLGVRQ